MTSPTMATSSIITGAAAAKARLPADMAERYGAELSVPDWHQRLVCG
jgi:hypothetical protein